MTLRNRQTRSPQTLNFAAGLFALAVFAAYAFLPLFG